jgi:hypothetical protein
MSVTFNRAQLIEVATSAIAAHDAAKADYDKAVEKLKADHLAAWKSKDNLRRLRDYLSAQIKKNAAPSVYEARQAVSDGGDLERLFYPGVTTYDIRDGVQKPKGLLTPAEVVEIGALLKVLGAATGDTVSVNELKLLGLKNLQPVFTAAAQEAGK